MIYRRYCSPTPYITQHLSFALVLISIVHFALRSRSEFFSRVSRRIALFLAKSFHWCQSITENHQFCGPVMKTLLVVEEHLVMRSPSGRYTTTSVSFFTCLFKTAATTAQEPVLQALVQTRTCFKTDMSHSLRGTMRMNSVLLYYRKAFGAFSYKP